MVRIDTGTTGASNRLIRGYQCAAWDDKAMVVFDKESNLERIQRYC